LGDTEFGLGEKLEDTFGFATGRISFIDKELAVFELAQDGEAFGFSG